MQPLYYFAASRIRQIPKNLYLPFNTSVLEDFVKFSLRLLFSLAFLTLTAFSVSAQVDSIVGQFTNTPNVLGGVMNVADISGDGRFVVFESTADIASDRSSTRNNADGNREIFIFDYAQRRIFQITNTKRALNDVNGSSTSNPNILVDVINAQPSISNQTDSGGRYWIAFASNAGVNVAGQNDPGNFDGNLCIPAATNCSGIISGTYNDTNRPTLAAIRTDGNQEIWMYQLPAVPPVDLSLGLDIPRVDLAAGTFLRATTTPARFPPVPGRAATTNPPVPEQRPLIADDNKFPSINDDGSVVAFVSDRNLDGRNPVGTDNREIALFQRGANAVTQLTVTNFGSLPAPINNDFPSISGDGTRIAFFSNANNPVSPTGTGNNTDGNSEIFYLNVNLTASPVTVSPVQVTNTVESNNALVVNILTAGRRISRDGKFIAFESASSAPLGSGTTQTTEGFENYALFVYEPTPLTPVGQTQLPPRAFQVGRRTFEDTAVFGGDVLRGAAFTDYAGTAPQSISFVSRVNYRADGTIPSTASEGLNPAASRPTQIYATPLLGPGTGGTTVPITSLTRLSQIQALSDLQLVASNSRRRIAFNFGSELGGGNLDGSYEGFYLISSDDLNTPPARGLTFATGASALPVGSPQPIPTPTASPSPSPTPQTPSAVRALSPDAVAIANLTYSRPRNTVTASGASRTQRSFELPIELAGVTVSVNGAAAGIYSIDWRRQQVLFVLPKGLANGAYTVTVNDDGLLSRGTLDITSSQPDIFTKNPLPSPFGRARVVNATNRVLQGEPFTVTTFRVRPPGRTATVFRVYLTGVQGAGVGNISIRVGNPTTPERPATVLTGAVPTDVPGEYSIDFTLPPSFNGAGDVPIIVTVVGNNSRLDDTAPRIRIL